MNLNLDIMFMNQNYILILKFKEDENFESDVQIIGENYHFNLTQNALEFKKRLEKEN